MMGETGTLLSGKVAVITGANRGIGKQIALAFIAAGAQVVACARDVDTLRGELGMDGVGAMLARCDITDPESVETVATEVLTKFGRVDSVVANAGITGAVKPLHELTYGEWRETITANLDGVFLTFRPFIPAMMRQGSGSLIALSSMTGKRPLANRTAYAASKIGVIGLVRSLALEVGSRSVRVNCVCPGVVDGERLRRMVAIFARDQGVSEDEALARFTGSSAFGRTTLPSEVADACVFLASDLSVGITGDDLNVSGGLVMY